MEDEITDLRQRVRSMEAEAAFRDNVIEAQNERAQKVDELYWAYRNWVRASRDGVEGENLEEAQEMFLDGLRKWNRK